MAAHDFVPSAVTLGNFDGVHAGHRRIFRRVRELAAAHDLQHERAEAGLPPHIRLASDGLEIMLGEGS